jgi:hypothetical protein
MTPTTGELKRLRELAKQVVQDLSDSEPTARSMDGMELLRGTPMESMFVLDGDTIEEAVYLALANAAHDEAEHVKLLGLSRREADGMKHAATITHNLQTGAISCESTKPGAFSRYEETLGDYLSEPAKPGRCVCGLKEWGDLYPICPELVKSHIVESCKSCGHDKACHGGESD